MNFDHDPNHPFFAVITGCSGVGKSTIIRALIKKCHPWLHFAVSCTTRPMREGESDGVDYHFISKERFKGLIESGSFLEYAYVHGNYYGTLKDEVIGVINKGHGNSVITDLDVQGAKSVMDCEDPIIMRTRIVLFISPPSIDVLRAQLVQRSTESAEEIDRRLSAAEIEMREASKLGLTQIVNMPGNIDHAIGQIGNAISAFYMKDWLGTAQ